MPPILNTEKLRKLREKRGEPAYSRELALPWPSEAADIALLTEIVGRHAAAPPEAAGGSSPMPPWFAEVSWAFISKYGRSKGGAILLKALARMQGGNLAGRATTP
jgi:hypothetical protein